MACVQVYDRASRAIGLDGAVCCSGTGRFCLHLCELCRVYKRETTIPWASRRYIFAHVAATKSSNAILLKAFGKFAGRTSLSLSILCSHVLTLLLSAGLSWRAWCGRWSRAARMTDTERTCQTSVNVALRRRRDSAAHPCRLCLHMCAACLVLRRGFHIEGAGAAAFP
jgi:hypothetical protein